MVQRAEVKKEVQRGHQPEVNLRLPGARRPAAGAAALVAREGAPRPRVCAPGARGRGGAAAALRIRWARLAVRLAVRAEPRDRRRLAAERVPEGPHAQHRGLPEPRARRRDRKDLVLRARVAPTPRGAALRPRAAPARVTLEPFSLRLAGALLRRARATRARAAGTLQRAGAGGAAEPALRRRALKARRAREADWRVDDLSAQGHLGGFDLS